MMMMMMMMIMLRCNSAAARSEMQPSSKDLYLRKRKPKRGCRNDQPSLLSKSLAVVYPDDSTSTSLAPLI